MYEIIFKWGEDYMKFYENKTFENFSDNTEWLDNKVSKKFGIKYKGNFRKNLSRIYENFRKH